METNIKNILDNATDQELQEILEHIVLRDLSACGYFMSDCEPEWLMKLNNPDWKPYSSKSFGEMLLDFACQWNMEHEGKNYEYKLDMVTEDYVSLETAKLLKEKGFDEDCTKVYINEELRDVITKESIEECCTHCFNHYLYPGDATAPTLQMTMKWLREVHHIFLSIQQHMDISYVWYAYVDGVARGCDRESHNNTYEQACEAAIKYCLTNLI